MAEIISTELKSDLENIYKTVGDLLNLLQTKDFEGENAEINELFSLVKFRLEDIEGTLQKDIYNCDYLLTKIRILQVPD